MASIGDFVTNDGVKIVYETQGEAHDTTLILIHGLLTVHPRAFKTKPSPLAQHSVVYRLDLRFHGDSEQPDWGHFVCRLSADVHDLITQLKLKNVVLLGTSMGCAIIWGYCMLYGTAGLKGAVFVDQSPLQNRRPDWELGSKKCYDEATLQMNYEYLKDFPTFAQGFGDVCLSKPIDDDYHALLTKETLKSSADAIGRLMEDHTRIDWRPVLPRINIPCLNCIGSKSGIFYPEGVETVGCLIPKCKNVTFPEENHWLHIENPERFNSVVLDYIREISDNSGV